MKSKPISPKLHGIIDYAFAATLIIAPPLLGLNKKARSIYRLLAADVVTYSALTDYPAGIKPVFSYDLHHKIDWINIAGLIAVPACKVIREDKSALAFHVGITAMAITNVLLTDWREDLK